MDWQSAGKHPWGTATLVVPITSLTKRAIVKSCMALAAVG